MIHWERYLYVIRDYVVLFLLLTISFIFIINNDKPQVHWMRSHVLELVGTWQNFVGSIYQYRALKTENEILRNRLALLSYENSMMKEAYLENDRLRKMLDFKKKSKFDLLPVSIIKRNYQGYSHAFIIDVGRNHGAEINLPVVSSNGLIGRIVAISQNSAVVQVLDDINFRISSMIQRSRVTGIIRPDQNFDLRFDYVPVRADVKVGDVVISSGLSDLYPKGIEIGIVNKVETPKTGLFKSIVVTSSVDLSHLEEAFVIQTKPAKIP